MLRLAQLALGQRMALGIKAEARRCLICRLWSVPRCGKSKNDSDPMEQVRSHTLFVRLCSVRSRGRIGATTAFCRSRDPDQRSDHDEDDGRDIEDIVES